MARIKKMQINKRIAEYREVTTKVVVMLASRDVKVTQIGSQAYVAYNKVTGLPERVNLPYVPDDATEETLVALRGFLDHEVAHILFTDAKQAIEVGNTLPKEDRGLFHTLDNILEDARIEKEMCARFGGSRRNIDAIVTLIGNKHIMPTIRQAIEDKDEPKRFVNSLLLVGRAWLGSTVAERMIEELGGFDAAVGKGSKYLKALHGRFMSMGDNYDVAMLAADLTKALRKPPEPEKEEPEPEETPEPEDQNDADSDDKADEPQTEAEPDSSDKDENGETEESQPDDDADGPSENDADADGDDGQGAPEDREPAPESEPADELNADESDESNESEDSQQDSSKEQPGEKDEDGEEDGESGEGVDLDNAHDGDGDGDDLDMSNDEHMDDAEPEDSGSKKVSAQEEEKEKTEENHREDVEATQSEYDEVPDLPITAPADADAYADSKMNEKAIAEVLSHSFDPKSYTVFSNEFDKIQKASLTAGDECHANIDKAVDRMMETLGSTVGQMQARMKRMFAQQNRTFTYGGFRSGRLKGNALHRLSLGDNRVFSRKETHNASDTAVTLLIDASGSMHGSTGGRSGKTKMAVAFESGMAMCMTLERVNVANEVIAFTTGGDYNGMYQELSAEQQRCHDNGVEMPEFARYSPLDIQVYKPFNEKLTHDNKRMIAATGYHQYGAPQDAAGNVDGESIMIALDRLMRQPQKRKVILVLSDGDPTADDMKRGQQHLKAVVEHVMASGVEIVGIGVGDDGVKNYYPNHVVMQNASELPSLVLGQLEKLLLN